MKINPPLVNKGSLPRPSDAGRATDAGKKSASVRPAPGPENPVALSTTARHLAQLAHAGQDVNLARVAEIRNALENGTLKINPERIADSLITSARELLENK